MYLITSESRKNKGMLLILKDRKRFRNGFWTSLIANAVIFSTKDSADFACSKLRYNNPKVMTVAEAREVVKPIITTRINHNYKRNRDITKMSDWEYKKWLGGTSSEDGADEHCAMSL